MGRTKIPKEIQVETWIIRDRINRYRGVLKLHARDKKLQLSQAVKLKSAVSRKLASLDVDVKKHREIVNDLSEGGKRCILRLLSDHREFRLAFDRLRPSEIYTAIYEDNNVKRRLLDKLYYEKKRRLKRAIELQVERSLLTSDYEEQNDDSSECEQQRLVARLQHFITKNNTANVIHSTYYSMQNILKKDAMFFDTLLSILQDDQSSQCKTMLKVTIMGQLATENLDDIRQKYKRMTRVVLRNMKIREQMLSTVRCQVQDLWSFAQSLVRVESDTVLARKDTDVSFPDKILENQLADLDNICGQVKETLLVHSYHELLSRLEDQTKQKTNLLARLNSNIKDRDILLNQKNHALQVLENLKHSTKTVTEQYKTNEHDILEQIEIERKREKDLRELKKTRGELLTNIRAALQSISAMLLCVKQTGRPAKKPARNGNRNTLKEVDDKEDTEERDVLPELEEMDIDVLVLLSKIVRKVNMLFAMSNFELERNKEERARDLYQTYVSNYSSNLVYRSGEEEPIGLLVEHETIDVNIPTRADIKHRSRQIIEAHLKPE